MSNAPFVKSGYGQQTNQVIHRLRDAGHEVAVFANYGVSSATQEYDGFRIFPNNEDSYGNELVAMWADMWFEGGPGLIITLYDVWALDPEIYKGYTVASWVPIDHLSVPPRVKRWFEDSGAIPIAMSEHGRGLLEAEGLNPLYAPHGIDTSVLCPRDRDEAREKTGLHVSSDDFLVGMVAANVSPSNRKNFDLTMNAFKVLRSAYDDVKLYIHANMTGRHGKALDLDVLATQVGISAQDLSFPNDAVMQLGALTEEGMSHFYSAMDVLVAPSMGEGFGIPVVEAQSCGVPVIVSDATAQSELCGAGWTIPVQPHYDALQAADWAMPLLREFALNLNDAYGARGDQKLRDEAREFALQYDADTVFEKYWLPILGKLEANLPSSEPITL